MVQQRHPNHKQMGLNWGELKNNNNIEGKQYLRASCAISMQVACEWGFLYKPTAKTPIKTSAFPLLIMVAVTFLALHYLPPCQIHISSILVYQDLSSSFFSHFFKNNWQLNKIQKKISTSVKQKILRETSILFYALVNILVPSEGMGFRWYWSLFKRQLWPNHSLIEFLPGGASV